MPHEARAHVWLSGRVQGVGFRLTAAMEARQRGVVGWVRNLDSGDVEAVFEGPRPIVEAMVRWCEEGPSGAYVRQARVSWDEPPEDLMKFEVRSTSAG